MVQNDIKSINFNDLEAGDLIDYIVSKLHGYTKQAFPLLLEYMRKVTLKYGLIYPQIPEIYYSLEKLGKEIDNHMNKEEQILFPYIKKLEELNKTSADSIKLAVSLAQSPLKAMEQEHQELDALMERIKMLSNNYSPPEGAETDLKLAYLELREFQHNQDQHVHLEHDVLFPKIIALEKVKKD